MGITGCGLLIILQYKVITNLSLNGWVRGRRAQAARAPRGDNVLITRRPRICSIMKVENNELESRETVVAHIVFANCRCA